MKRFSLFFLLMGGLVLSQPATAQTRVGAAEHFASAKPALSAGPVAVVGHPLHSSQLPLEVDTPGPVALPVPTSAAAGPLAAVATSKSQLLLVLLETIQAQQARLDSLQVEANAASRRASRAEAATEAFEQRLRQLEAANSRPGFWR